MKLNNIKLHNENESITKVFKMEGDGGKFEAAMVCLTSKKKNIFDTNFEYQIRYWFKGNYGKGVEKAPTYHEQIYWVGDYGTAINEFMEVCKRWTLNVVL